MKRAEMQKLIDGVLSGEMRAIAKTLTVCENDPEGSIDLVRSLYSRGGRAHVIGITGAPGAGKSTLVDRLALKWHEGGKKVAILAVDPSSPFSGGAILGDRIRMHNTAAYPDIFIRSMASRGVLGGLARAAYDAVTVLDAAGFDIVMVETVGVGQGEVDIVRTAQSCLVVLVPGMGDEVQAFKAGILEIADLFVINKSDHLGADNLERDILTLLSLEESQEGAWKPKVLRTVATKGDGVAELCEKIAAHKEWLSSSP
ncbi:MAG: methylmalonyl Co-A mutase-associated GTPase MeaB, partial [Deltaproteobacteria bacterium]|nr:methylmalonyl Co-A mutase-associated GTPase MeaB [Deltaproteobacteria bacterium]